MRRRLCISLSFACIINLISCKHDRQAPSCQQQTFTVTPFLKQFEFKLTSYWVYASPNSTQIDTIKVITSTGGKWSYPYCNNSPNNNNSSVNCMNNENHCYQYEVYEVSFRHRTFETPDFFGSRINYGYIFVPGNSNYGSSVPRFLITNAGDSLTAGGNFSKLENKYDTLTVSGTKYNNVYQMYYAPASQNFQRIWWCPNIGFIKFEYVNFSHQIETWYLQGSHIVL